MKQLYYLLAVLITMGFVSCKKEMPQADVDEKTIKDYLTLNNITATRTASGLYYRILSTTNGALPTIGKKLSVRYLGQVLYGVTFDNNYSSSNPFIFTLGAGQVIPGWDEGFLHVKLGEQAEFYIPSGLGYGTGGNGSNIPPNSVLYFKVTLENIQ